MDKSSQVCSALSLASRPWARPTPRPNRMQPVPRCRSLLRTLNYWDRLQMRRRYSLPTMHGSRTAVTVSSSQDHHHTKIIIKKRHHHHHRKVIIKKTHHHHHHSMSLPGASKEG